MSIVEAAGQPLSSRITGRQWLVLVQVTTLTFGMTITATNVVPQIRGALSATQDQVV